MLRLKECIVPCPHPSFVAWMLEHGRNNSAMLLCIILWTIYSNIMFGVYIQYCLLRYG